MKYSIIELQSKAVRAWIDGSQVCIALEDGRELRFPFDKNPKLKSATPEQLANIDLICGGTGIHWPDLDEDLTVLGILEGRLGSG
jgi:hypothetical protein